MSICSENTLSASAMTLPRAQPVQADVPHPEAELIARLIARDERAFRTFYREYSDDVYRLSRQFVHSDAEADDVVQEVFIAAFRYIGRFRGQARLRTWLYRITVNRSLKRRRWWSRRREVGADALLHRAERGPAPETRVADREALALTRGCLEKIEIKKRTVLILHELEGLDTKEIAGVLTAPGSPFLPRLSRARHELVRRAERAGIDVGDRQ